MQTYLAYDGRHYKVGQSADPEQRIKNLRTANPKIKLIAYGNRLTERELHEYLRRKRICGEWFNLSRKEVNEIIRRIGNEYSGIQIKVEPDNETEEKRFQKFSEFRITFGKYSGSIIKNMNSLKELKYLEWCVENFKNKRSRTVRVFKWWIKQHKAAV